MDYCDSNDLTMTVARIMYKAQYLDMKFEFSSQVFWGKLWFIEKSSR